MTNIAAFKINRTVFPELDHLLWDNTARDIPALEAFHKYEERWKFVDERNIQANERMLLDILTAELGQGIFLAA